MEPLKMDGKFPSLVKFKTGFEFNIKLLVAILVLSVIAGVGTGYLMASTGNRVPILTRMPKHAAEDTKTFRDFAEGKITKKPDGKNDQYNQGTHLLMRDGTTPVLLTSSVVDLSEYENKKVKLFGETNSLPGTGWFMDVGRVEVIQ